MAKGRAPKLAGVVGWPVEHSLSPLIHTIWATRAGVEGYYIPIAIQPEYEAFARAMDSLRTIGFEGVNVTIPHKEHALRYAAEISAVAKEIGAANMLTFKSDAVIADNSDSLGFQKGLLKLLGTSSGRTSALILGAGGAARGVAKALRDLGFLDVEITNRTQETAESVASDFGLGVVAWDDRNDRLSRASVVVNTTSLGMIGQPELETDPDRFQTGSIIADIVYSPLETPLLKAAKQRGHLTMNGLEMLMHQAAPGFRAWFGAEAVVDDDLRHHLVNELNRRSAHD